MIFKRRKHLRFRETVRINERVTWPPKINVHTEAASSPRVAKLKGKNPLQWLRYAPAAIHTIAIGAGDSARETLISKTGKAKPG